MAIDTGMSDELLGKLNITRDEYVRIKGIAHEREKNVPQVGDMAPDFNLERLTGTGERSGEFVSLAALRGKPAVLYFGSFT